MSPAAPGKMDLIALNRNAEDGAQKHFLPKEPVDRGAKAACRDPLRTVPQHQNLLGPAGRIGAHDRQAVERFLAREPAGTNQTFLKRLAGGDEIPLRAPAE